MTFDLCLSRVVLVENIPEDVSFPPSGPTYLPLTAGLHDLLDRAMRSLEIVSPVWLLNSSDYEASSQRASLQVWEPHSLHKAFHTAAKSEPVPG